MVQEMVMGHGNSIILNFIVLTESKNVPHEVASLPVPTTFSSSSTERHSEIITKFANVFKPLYVYPYTR